MALTRKHPSRNAVHCIGLHGLAGLLFVLLRFPGDVSAAPPRMPAETLGRLLYTPVEIRIEQQSLRDAFRLLSAALETPILFREDVEGGFRGDVPITLQIEKPIAAMDALELLIDAAALHAEATWQLRTGFIEVGTKRALSRSGRTDVQVHDLTDLRLEPPDSENPFTRAENDFVACEYFHQHKYRSAHVAERTSFTSDPNCTECRRKSGDEVLHEFVRLVAGVIEPGNWNLPDGFDDLGWLSTDPAQPGQYPTHASREPEKAVGRIRIEHGRTLAVLAPDFMQRAIAGYPKPLKPVPPSDDVLERRAQRATSGSSSVRPLGTHDRIDGEESARPFGPLLDLSIGTPVSSQRIWNQLARARVSIDVAARPLREVLDHWGVQLQLPVLGRFHDDTIGHGLDPDARVSLNMQDVSAIEALEFIIGEATGFSGQGMWQIRHGFVEVGTKARLSVPAAREIRVYPIGDLFIGNQATSLNLNSNRRVRLPSEVTALNVVSFVVENVEPGTWDHGQPLLDGPQERSIPEMPVAEDSRPQVLQPVYQPLPAVASIRVYRDLLIVNAPDYYHRLIGGYSTPNTSGKD